MTDRDTKIKVIKGILTMNAKDGTTLHQINSKSLFFESVLHALVLPNIERGYVAFFRVFNTNEAMAQITEYHFFCFFFTSNP